MNNLEKVLNTKGTNTMTVRGESDFIMDINDLNDEDQHTADEYGVRDLTVESES